MTTPSPYAKNISWHCSLIPRDEFEERLGQKGCVLWFTGLSGAGKSTVARCVERALFRRGYHPFVLDGDNVRHGLCSDLGFGAEDRKENIRRIAHVAELFVEAGVITLTAFISPYREDREQARQIIGEDRFFEVFVDAPVEACEERDPKGLYKKARAGEIDNFTGISAPYEPPEDPALHLPTGEVDLDGCVERTVRMLESRGLIGEKREPGAG